MAVCLLCLPGPMKSKAGLHGCSCLLRVSNQALGLRGRGLVRTTGREKQTSQLEGKVDIKDDPFCE